MTDRSFLASNLTLIVGVCLPLLLVLLFWIAMVIPRMSVDDPQYDLILSSYNYDSGARQLEGNLAFEVRDGRLFARFRAIPEVNQVRGNAIGALAIPVPTLYYFESATGNLREVDYPLPENPEDDELYPVTLPWAGEIFTGSVAPDGYSFDNSYRGSRGFLFFTGGYRYSAKIEKAGRAVKIPSIDQNNYYGLQSFVAWAAPGGN